MSHDPPINPPTHPPTDQTMHPPIGGEVSTEFKSLNRIELSSLVQVLLHIYQFGCPPLEVGWVGVHGGVSGWGSLHRIQIFKQNCNIFIYSRFIMFQLIWGVSPWGGWGLWMWVCVGVWKGASYMHACAHMHMHAHMHDDIIGFPQGFPHGDSHLH